MKVTPTFALAAIVTACAAETPLEDDPLSPRQLALERTVIVGGVDDGTDWLANAGPLRYDADSEVLFVLDYQLAAVHELTRAGEHIRSYGSRGEGPGELRGPKTIALTSKHVAVLDIGNGKVALFDRRDGAVAQEIRLSHTPWGMSTVGDTAIAVVPGSDGAAFDMVSTDGEPLGSFGDGGFFSGGGPCSCLIADLGRGRVVITRGNDLEGRILSLEGDLLGAFGFAEVRHVVDEWADVFREHLEEAGAAIAGGAPGRLPGGKDWISDLLPAGDGQFLVGIIPEELMENPRELWQLDAEGRVTGRYIFDRIRVGMFTASFPEIFTTGVADASIYEFRVGARAH